MILCHSSDEVESVLGRDVVQAVGLARKPRRSEAGKERCKASIHASKDNIVLKVVRDLVNKAGVKALTSVSAVDFLLDCLEVHYEPSTMVITHVPDWL